MALPIQKRSSVSPAHPVLIRNLPGESSTHAVLRFRFLAGLVDLVTCSFPSFPSNTADPEADGRKSRAVDSARIRNLKQQRFVGLLEARPPEDNDTIGTLSGSKPPGAHSKFLDRQLLGVGPDLAPHDRSPLHLAGELHLRRHQLHRVFLNVDNGE
jgi:hypothetical protein